MSSLRATDVTVRLARIEDLDALVQLRQLMQQEVHSARAADAAFASRTRTFFEKSMRDDNGFTFIAIDDDAVVSTATVVAYEALPSLANPSVRCGLVVNVFTLPAYRGRGLAEQVMQALVGHARQCGFRKLHLNATEAGQGIYLKVGFGQPRLPAYELEL